MNANCVEYKMFKNQQKNWQQVKITEKGLNWKCIPKNSHCQLFALNTIKTCTVIWQGNLFFQQKKISH